VAVGHISIQLPGLHAVSTLPQMLHSYRYINNTTCTRRTRGKVWKRETKQCSFECEV